MAERLSELDLRKIELTAAAFLQIYGDIREPSERSSHTASFTAAVPALVAEIRRLRKLLVNVYPFVTDAKGSDELRGELEREVKAVLAERLGRVSDPKGPEKSS